MINLLLAIIYLSFISLGLPDGLLGAAWPTMCLEMDVPVSYAGLVSVTICAGTIVSSLLSDRLTLRFGTGKITAVSVAMTAMALLGFSLPLYAEEGKTGLVIAVGCTGGHHRSVAIAHALAAYITTLGYQVAENHRDISRG